MRQDGLIIVLLRNNLALSRECLKSLKAQTVPVTILAVDNASTDGTKQWLRTERDIRVMSFEEQVSVAEAWNTALRWGWSQGYDETLVVNNDTWLLPETYQTLSDWTAADDGRTTGMVTCVSRREMSELVYKKPFSHRPNPDYSCYMLQRWAHEQVPFDENYLIAFGEDGTITSAVIARASAASVSVCRSCTMAPRPSSSAMRSSGGASASRPTRTASISFRSSANGSGLRVMIPSLRLRRLGWSSQHLA